MTTWKPEVLVDGKWVTNGLVFATKAEAEAWGQDLLLRWFVPRDARATETTDPVNYTYDREKGLVRIEEDSDVVR